MNGYLNLLMRKLVARPNDFIAFGTMLGSASLWSFAWRVGRISFMEEMRVAEGAIENWRVIIFTNEYKPLESQAYQSELDWNIEFRDSFQRKLIAAPLCWNIYHTYRVRDEGRQFGSSWTLFWFSLNGVTDLIDL